MKKKGFTLIELLAVIVILAIIALIATPLVLKYIEKSRQESKVDSAYSFVRNLETEIANYSIKNNGKKYSGQPTDKGYYELTSFENSEIDTTVKGDKPNSIKVCLSSLGQVDKAMFEYGKYYVSYDGKKGSISDEATYSSFSCSGNVAGGGNNGGSNVGDLIVSELEIEFVEEDGISVAMLDTCLDTSLFEYGKYYNITLTDDAGKNYTHRLIAQGSGVGATTDEFSLVLSSPQEMLFYMHNISEDMCMWGINEYVDESNKYKGSYKIEITSNNEPVEPNYVFRLSKPYETSYYSTLEFYSTDLKAGDEVTFEVVDPTYTSNNGVRVFTSIAAANKDIAMFNKLHFKYVTYMFNEGGLSEATDINVIINGGEKTYNFKKEDFKHVDNGDLSYVGLFCVNGTYYYVGNADIDHVHGC